MPKKVRVYELGRELGLSNKETLDLCEGLGIAAKSHSSSIVEAQADRVRRKAEREGLIREVPAEEVEKKEGAAASSAAISTKKPPPKKKKPAAKAESAEGEPVPTAEAPTVAASTPPPAPAKPKRVVSSSGSQGPPPRPVPEAPAPVAEAPAPEPVVEAPAPAPVAEAPAPEAAPTVEAAPAAKAEASADAGPVAKAPEESAPEAKAPEANAPVTKAPDGNAAEAATPAADAPDATTPETAPAAKADAAPTTAPPEKAALPKGKDGRPLKSALPTPPPAPASDGSGAPTPPADGKPIPPPPRGLSGKPIPPPPVSRGGPRPGARAVRPGSRPGGPSPRPGGGGGAPGAGAGAGAPRPGGGAPPSRPGGGGRGRPGGGPRRPPRRKRRSRRREELQPIDMPTYTPDNAPVPDGKIVVERASSPQELASKTNRTTADVVRFLMQNGEMVTATQSLSDDMIELFADDVGVEIQLVNPGEEAEVELQKVLGIDELYGEEQEEEGTDPRPPVITVMGHVDHGKTLLLDRIRDANVVAGEAGGITQHIGAYQVERDGQMLTFIDTPGHEAFTAMRARGADATDIVILMVAADDGFMPQTLEALDHARAADVPILVAINKIDRENADVDRVMSQLSEHGCVPEKWGGDTVTAEISALKNEGIDDLLDSIVVMAELEELVARPDGRAMGSVLEAHLDKGRGPVATILVQNGMLRVGDPLVAGPAWGRVRALINSKGEQVKEAGPSTPVQVLGLSDVADAGDDFIVAPDEKKARAVAETREHWQRVASLGRDAGGISGGARLEDLFKQIQSGEAATLNLIVKADVTGSLEAVLESLKRLERDEVKLAFVLRGVGGITENDVQLAAASNATILGFNVRPDRKARELAEQEKVEIRNYEIIYKLLEDIENAMLGLLEPETEEVVTGDAEVREIFGVPKLGKIAGCMVTNGVITRNSKVRFLREGTIIWKGEVQSLRRFKDDVKEVATGFECGIGLSDFQDLKPGDIIETFEDREIPRT